MTVSAGTDRSTVPSALPPAAPVLSLALCPFGSPPGGDWRGLLDLARSAEDAGIGRLVVTDHVVNGPEVASYPWGRFPTGPEADWLEPLTVLTAIAAVTSTVRLGTGVLIAPLRPAAVLAKTVATLDVLSGGRVDLGVGTGWQADEFDAVGLDFAQRGQLLTDTIGACRALWAGGPSSFASPTMSFSDIYCAPLPVQTRLPVWFSGALHDRNVDRIVRLGDGWIPIMGSTPEQIADGAELLRAAFAQAGRSDTPGVRFGIAPVRVGGGEIDWAATMAGVPAMLAAGVTEVHMNVLALDPRLADVGGACRRLVAEFEAAVDGRP